MKKFVRWPVICGAFGFFLMIAGTQPSYAAPSAGSNEILLSGGLNHTQGTDSGSLNVDLNYGYYLTPGWELGFRQALNYTFIDDHRDDWIATTTPFLYYNFRVTDTFLPYLGAFIGLAWNDRDVTGTLGPAGGLKMFMSDQTFVNVGYRYEWLFNSLRNAFDNRSHGNHVVNIGIGFVWGGTGRQPKP